MEKLGLNEIRSRFLKFYESKDHYVGKSASLIPRNDKSILIINSGMAPLKAYFAGTEFNTPCQGFLLKIISEAEVSKHFKECTVSCGMSYIVNITCSDTFLTGTHSLLRRCFRSGEIRLQLCHP